MRRKGLPHTKTVTARGRRYTYFVTGQTGADGKAILARLPEEGSPQFGAAYAAHLAVMTKRANIKTALTVTDLIELYQRSPKYDSLADGSRKLYDTYLKQFREALPTAPAGEVARQDVLRLMDLRGKTPAAANSLFRTINALYKWARTRGHVTNEPTKDIAVLSVGEHQPWPQALVDAALKADDARVRLGVHLLLYTAQRIGDVCAMRWTDIRDGSFHLIQQKTGRELVIQIHEVLAAELATHPRTLGYILSNRRGVAIGSHTLRVDLQTSATERGYKVVPHGLRKNAVIELLQSGCSAAETAAISGQSLQMVEYYAKGRSQEMLGKSAILKWQIKR